MSSGPTGRDRQRLDWTRAVLAPATLDAPPVLLAGAASTRRFWRLQAGGRALVLVDAPPPAEDCARFVRLARWFGARGVPVPEVVAADPERGFALVSDLGGEHLDQRAARLGADRPYAAALDALVHLQALAVDPAQVPAYEADRFRMELGIFNQWIVAPWLDGALPDGWDRLVTALVDSAMDQPRVVVHRDWHCRNLMFDASGRFGIVDFQDALHGPVLYDLVSLLRDCYADWPEAQVAAWQAQWRQRARAAGIPVPPPARFAEAFDLLGIQRHLKATGIFARLWLDRGNPSHLHWIDGVLGRIARVGARRPVTAPLADWIDRQVRPALRAPVAAALADSAAPR